MKHLVIAATFAAVSATTLSAGQGEANACAANLDGDSKLIYDRVAPQVTTDRKKNEAMVKSTVRGMIDNGEVAFFGVRKKAQAAVKCVMLINS